MESSNRWANIFASAGRRESFVTRCCSSVPTPIEIKTEDLDIFKQSINLDALGTWEIDSSKRQKEICRSYCTANKLERVQIFYDEGISSKQPVLKRNGFKSLYTFCLDTDIRIVVFEGLSRFSRDLYEQELAYKKLSEDGFKLVSATNEGELEDSP